MTERRHNAVIICAIAWLLLSLNVPTAVLLAHFGNTSALSQYVSDVLSVTSVISFLTVFYFTLVLVIAWNAETESDDSDWGVQKSGVARAR